MPAINTRYGQFLGRFADFSKGEYGGLGGRHAQPGQWTGLNCVAYLDGSIGPRPGVENATPLSDTFHLPYTGPTNVMLIGRERGGDQRLWVLGDDDLVYGADYVSSPSVPTWGVYTGSVSLHSGADSIVDYVDDTLSTYITSWQEGTFSVNHDTKLVTLLPDSPGGRCCTIFGEHLVVAGMAGFGNHIRFSAANNYSSWDALDFIELGRHGAVIQSLQVQRNVLVVTMDHGDIYTISGTLSVNDDTRQSTSIAPRITELEAARVSVTKRGIIWRRGRNVVPESFDGSQLRSLPHLNNWARPSQTESDLAICPGADDDDILFFGSQGSLLALHNGAWTRHAMAIAPSLDDTVYATYDGDALAMFATRPESSGTDIWRLALGLERPPVASLGDTIIDNGGTAPDATFTTTELRDTAGRGMRPRGILVRFTKYETGGAQTNHFDLYLNALDVYELDQPAPLFVASFDEDNATATPEGTRTQHFYGVNAGVDAAALSITVSALRGIAIDEIVVFGDVEPART